MGDDQKEEKENIVFIGRKEIRRTKKNGKTNIYLRIRAIIIMSIKLLLLISI